ncbi:MAG: hypothetical protein RSB10_00370 [Clostridia bacterium]
MKKSKILCMFFLMLNLCCIFIFPTFASAEELDNANHQYSNYIDWEQTRKIVNTKDVISIDAGNPIMLFAAVEDPSTAGAQSIMHAIVAHTYHERLGFMGARKYSYVCHFGWGPKYNNVEVHNAIKYITVGTSYMLEMK